VLYEDPVAAFDGKMPSDPSPTIDRGSFIIYHTSLLPVLAIFDI
jgi:hypothetical protein